jgi:hypothetical protein
MTEESSRKARLLVTDRHVFPHPEAPLGVEAFISFESRSNADFRAGLEAHFTGSSIGFAPLIMSIVAVHLQHERRHDLQDCHNHLPA